MQGTVATKLSQANQLAVDCTTDSCQSTEGNPATASAKRQVAVVFFVILVVVTLVASVSYAASKLAAF